MASIAGKGMPRWYLGRSPEAPKPYYGELVIRTTTYRLTRARIEVGRTYGDLHISLERS